MKIKKTPHILLTGGGTLGPAMPLLAIYEEWKARMPQICVSWVGTFSGPEQDIIKQEKSISFYSLYAPKLSRHAWWTWIFIPMLFLFSCVWAYILLRKLRPDIIYTAGGYVSIPLVLVGYCMRIPIWVHQLDIVPGIANRIMVRFATCATVTFQESVKTLPGMWIGGMVRHMQGDKERAYRLFGFQSNKPTILLIGGGTGAVQLNEAMLILKDELISQYNILHSFGKGKIPATVKAEPGYYPTELFIEDLADAYAIADVLIARGGLGTLLEAVVHALPSIIIPIAGSHQEQNSQIVENHHAGIVLKNMTPQTLLKTIHHLFSNRMEQEAMGRNMGALIPLGAEKNIVQKSMQILDLDIK